MKKIKILLTFFVATLLVLGILSQLSVWYDNRAAAPAKRLLQGKYRAATVKERTRCG